MKENYWKKAEDNKIKAQKQIKFMEENFSKQTTTSSCQSHIYTQIHSNNFEKHTSYNLVIDRDTTQAILEINNIFQTRDKKYKITALNFASYTSPGGKFIEGSNAQEESLCHSSNLYNILAQCPDYYIENKKHFNQNLFTDRALYSPNVVFHNQQKTNFVKADILTCAAPNWTRAQEYENINKLQNTLTLFQRMQFIKSIAETQQVDVLILGAWGCGVFGQDPQEVAQCFNFVFDKTTIKNIVYAVPKDINPINFDAFDKWIRRS